MEHLNMNNNEVVYTGETKNIKKAFDHLQNFLNTRHSKLTVDELYGEISRGTKGVDGLAARRILAGKEKNYFDLNSWMRRVENEIVSYKAMLHYLEDLYLDDNLSEKDWDGMFKAMEQLKSPEDRLEGGEELWEGGFEGIFSFLIESLRKNFMESGVLDQYASEAFLRENMLHFNKEFFLNYFAPALELDENSLNLILTKVLGEYQIDYYDRDQFLLYLAMELFVNHTGFGYQSEYQLLQELKVRYDQVKPGKKDFLKEYSERYSQDTRSVAGWMRDRLRTIAPAGLPELDEILKKHKATFSIERKRTAEKYLEELWTEVCRYYRADINAFFENDKVTKMMKKQYDHEEYKWELEIRYEPGVRVVIPEKTRFCCTTKGRAGERTIYLETYEEISVDCPDGNSSEGKLGVRLCEESRENYDVKNGYRIYAEKNSDVRCEAQIPGIYEVTNQKHRLQISPRTARQNVGNIKRQTSDYSAVLEVKTINSSYEGDKVNMKNNTSLRLLNTEELEQAGYAGIRAVYAHRAVKQRVSDKDKGELEIQCSRKIVFQEGTRFRCSADGAAYEFRCMKNAAAVKPHEKQVRNTLSVQEERERLIRYLYYYEEDDAGNLLSGTLEPELWDKVMGKAMLESGTAHSPAGRKMRDQLLTLYFLKFIYTNREQCGDRRMVLDAFIRGVDRMMDDVRLPIFYLRNPLDCMFAYFLCFDEPLDAYRMNWSQYLYYKNKGKTNDEKQQTTDV